MTFDQARDLVGGNSEVREIYPFDNFVVADYGWEDDEKFLVVAGTRMDVTGEGNFDDMTMDPPSVFVYKKDGEVVLKFGLRPLNDPTANMSPIGPVPA